MGVEEACGPRGPPDSTAIASISTTYMVLEGSEEIGTHNNSGSGRNGHT